ncbi:MAG: hypothetical protein EB060_00670 [Proteobacteria bacterium]|nr:hypothetical protein [Pseudomonadota bacterium]
MAKLPAATASNILADRLNIKAASDDAINDAAIKFLGLERPELLREVRARYGDDLKRVYENHTFADYVRMYAELRIDNSDIFRKFVAYEERRLPVKGDKAEALEEARQKFNAFSFAAREVAKSKKFEDVDLAGDTVMLSTATVYQQSTRCDVPLIDLLYIEFTGTRDCQRNPAMKTVLNDIFDGTNNVKKMLLRLVNRVAKQEQQYELAGIEVDSKTQNVLVDMCAYISQIPVEYASTVGGIRSYVEENHEGLLAAWKTMKKQLTTEDGREKFPKLDNLIKAAIAFNADAENHAAILARAASIRLR